MVRRLIIGLIVSIGLTGAAAAQDLKLADNAPDRHVVVPGDTLWGIAGRFLKDPWRWPQLFELNKDQIRNPHRIYPGDVIVLDRNALRARLLGSQTVKLTPRARAEQREADAIPVIPPAHIEPFLSQPLVLDQAALDSAPRIVATEEHRVVIGPGSRAYVRGIGKDAQEQWQVFRPGEKLIDPESKEAIGFEAIYLGDARVLRQGDVTTVEIVKAGQEIYIGDRMFARPKALFPNYAPHAPEKAIKGRVIAAYGGLVEVGSNAIVTINRGSRDGLTVGSVLAAFRSAESSADTVRAGPLYEGRTGLFRLEGRGDSASVEPLSGVRNSPLYGRQGPTGRDDSIKPVEAERDLPVDRHGLLFVFRTFERVSYALVMQATRPVHVMDFVQNP